MVSEIIDALLFIVIIASGCVMWLRVLSQCVKEVNDDDGDR